MRVRSVLFVCSVKGTDPRVRKTPEPVLENSTIPVVAEEFILTGLAIKPSLASPETVKGELGESVPIPTPPVEDIRIRSALAAPEFVLNSKLLGWLPASQFCRAIADILAPTVETPPSSPVNLISPIVSPVNIVTSELLISRVGA